MKALLKLSGIETWHGSICALKHVSLEVFQGQIAVLLGPNGAGKTTVLKTVMRSLYDQKRAQPEKGSIEFEGKRIDRLKTGEIVRRGIGCVPEGREIFPELTVRENILMGAYTCRGGKDIRADIETVYRYFPILRERKDRQAGYLSGGEQQLLAIARALMGRPKLLMLDEPSLGLSPMMTREIFEIIRSINLQEGMTVLVIEQNANIALQYAHYVFLLENGRVVHAGKPEVMKRDKRVREAYLGSSDNSSP